MFADGTLSRRLGRRPRRLTSLPAQQSNAAVAGDVEFGHRLTEPASELGGIAQRSESRRSTAAARKLEMWVAEARRDIEQQQEDDAAANGDLSPHEQAMDAITGQKAFGKTASEGTVHELGAVLYDKLNEEELPNFISHVKLNPDGGLERLEEIWAPQKYIWCTLLFATVAFNVLLLLTVNWAIFHSVTINFFHEDQEIVSMAVSGNVTSTWRIAQRSVTTDLSSEDAVKSSSEMADIFKHIEDPDTRANVLTVAAAVASIEVLYILWIVVVHIANRLFVFALARSEYESFAAITEVVRLTLPQLSTFSALKLIARVHPVLIYGEFLEVCSQPTRSGFAVAFAWFVCSRLFFGMTAVSAFAVKVLAVGLRFIEPQISWILRWAAVVALLNNCMGIVLIERVLQDRLFLFVFGGQDTDFQNEERALLRVYQCRIAKRIWTSYWHGGQKLKAIVILATLDHYDLQRLLIEDVEDDDTVITDGAPSNISPRADEPVCLLTRPSVKPSLLNAK